MGIVDNMKVLNEQKQREREILKKIRHNKIVTEDEFYNMLQLSFPCKNVIRLHHPMKDEAEYFLMSKTYKQIVKAVQDDEALFRCKFKQLTGENAGKIYDGWFNHGSASADKMYIYPSRHDKNKVSLSINLYSWYDIEECAIELTKEFGETISLAELLMLWKTESSKMMNIDILNNQDYKMVTKVYNSEDILKTSNNQSLNK